MHNTLESIGVGSNLLILILLLLVAQLLLVDKRLLKLHLLLHLLLLIRQYRMLTRLLLLWPLSYRGRPWDIHAHSLLVLDGWPLHGVGIWSRVLFAGEITSHVLPFHYLLLHRFIVYRWVCVWVEYCIWHALILVLVWVYLRGASWCRVEVGVIYVLHDLVLLARHGSISGSESLGLSASSRSWNVLQVMSSIRSVLLRKWLNRSSLIWKNLGSVTKRSCRSICVAGSLMLRRSHLHLLLLLKHLLRLAESPFNLLLLLLRHIALHLHNLLFLAIVPRHLPLAVVSAFGSNHLCLRPRRSTLLLEAAQVSANVKRWLRTHLLLLVQRNLMIELLKQQFRIV